MLPQAHGPVGPWEDHRIDSRPRQHARRARSSRNPLLEPRGGDVVVFLLAHPDDESLFTGGTIARVAAAGAETVVVTATLGELGRPNDPVVRARLSDDASLGPLRLDELRRACAALGVTDHLLLGGEGRFADSGYDSRGWAASSLANNVDGAANELITLLREVRPDVIVTFGRDGCSGHPDHVACHEIGVRAATALSVRDERFGGLALVADPTRPGRRGRPADGAELIEVDVAAVRDRREAAVRCHVSQVGDAVDDVRRLARFGPGSAVARYLPHAVSQASRARHEGFAWITAERLAAAGAA
jgi:N-acetyl-1-D-myo-inositol-2-amino-2-deoxy-alpha-D-glucopyranoside deacetylase